MTQAELAKCLGVTESYISYLESGKREPSIETLKKMSLIMEVSIDELLGGWYSQNMEERLCEIENFLGM